MIQGVSKLITQVILVDDVGGLRVQLPNFVFVEPLFEASDLWELAAGLQHHQDKHQAEQQVDCDGQPVQMWVLDVLLSVVLSGDIIPEADGRKRDETEIQRLQEVPVALQAGETQRRDDEKEHGYDDGKEGGVYGGQLRFRHGPSAVEIRHGTSTH